MKQNPNFYWDRESECFRDAQTDARIEGNPPAPSAAVLFKVPAGPTLGELEAFSNQFTEEEWSRLLTNTEFINAACVSLEQTARIAAQLLGRDVHLDF